MNFTFCFKKHIPNGQRELKQSYILSCRFFAADNYNLKQPLTKNDLSLNWPFDGPILR